MGPETVVPYRIPPRPAHPDRICWGCDRLCPADAMRCGSDVVRGMHPAELFGADWSLEGPIGLPAVVEAGSC